MRRLDLKRINHARDRHEKVMKKLREERRASAEREAFIDLQNFIDQKFAAPKKPSLFERLWSRLATRSNAEHTEGGLCK